MGAALHNRDIESEVFYEGAWRRMSRILLALVVSLSALTSVVLGWRLAAAFAAGSLVGYVNFHWLKRGVAALVEALAETRKPAPRTRIIAGFLLRYALLAAAAYVIFRGSDSSLYAFFAGLFLPVAAMMLEAAYEGWVAVRRGL